MPLRVWLTGESRAGLLLLLAAVAAAFLVAQSDDDRLHVVLQRDAIPAIDDPVFDDAGRVRMLGEELVIGLVGEGEARAYSTWELDQHEIVNDVFAARAGRRSPTAPRPPWRRCPSFRRSGDARPRRCLRD